MTEETLPPAIKAIRTLRGLSQAELAGRLKSSIRALARIEAGAQLCRLDMARRMAGLLDVTVERLFPGSDRLLAKLPTNRGPSNEQLNALSACGLDVDPRYWSVTIKLRGGHELLLPIDGAVFIRLFSAVQRTRASERFVCFDSEGRRYLVNLDHALLCHFTFEAFDTTKDEAEEDDFDLRVRFANDAEELSFDVEPDDTDGEDIGQLAHLLQMAQLATEDDQHFVGHFEDVDGEDVFLRMSDVALMSMPVEAVSPAAMEDHDGGTDDLPTDDAAAHSREARQESAGAGISPPAEGANVVDMTARGRRDRSRSGPQDEK